MRIDLGRLPRPPGWAEEMLRLARPPGWATDALRLARPPEWATDALRLAQPPAWAADALRLPIGLVKHALALLPPEAEEQLGGLARRIPPGHLEALMRSPLRGPALELLFWQLPLQLDRHRIGTASASIRWRITGGPGGSIDVYDLLIGPDGSRAVRGGGEPAPRLTITIDGGELVRIATGSSDPLSAYFARRLSVRGDLMQAARLTTMFRIPSPWTTGQGRPRQAPGG
jgi:hypothetical protein